MKALKCPNCGGNLEENENFKFCPYCGASISDAEKHEYSVEINSNETKTVKTEHTDKAQVIENIESLIGTIFMIALSLGGILYLILK